MIKEPLLAATITEADLDKLHYPVLVSPKIDGIRCLTVDGKVMTRKLKPIPNKYISTMLEPLLTLTGGISLDGELITEGTFQDTTSAVMSVEGKPQFNYKIFDCDITTDEPFNMRQQTLRSLILPFFCQKIMSAPCYNVDEVLKFEKAALTNGFEGIMIRSFSGRYKQGRSTINEEILLKLKRFIDAEAVIVGFEELISEPGEVKMNTLGALWVKDSKFTEEFKIGSGFDQATRAVIWDNRNDYMGKQITYKYQGIGMLNKPRFPVFKGMRKD